MPGQGRLAVTAVYQPILEFPSQSIHVPRRYRACLCDLAGGSLAISRALASELRAPIGETQLSRGFDAYRGLEKISVDRIGGDIGSMVTAVVTSADAGVVHVDLPMNDPAIDDAVEELGRSAFAFAAWLAGWAGHDVLRIQHVVAPTDAELSPSLSPRPREIS